MFARITHYQMKPESREPATDLLHSLKAEIMGIPGMQNHLVTMNADGSSVVVAVHDNEESAGASADHVASIWAKFADHLTTAPDSSGYDVISQWSN